MALTMKASSSVVVDANVAIALCAKEANKIAAAEAKITEYATSGCQFYAPGAIVMECLFVFCRKLKDGILTPTEHAEAIKAFILLMKNINPPPRSARIAGQVA